MTEQYVKGIPQACVSWHISESPHGSGSWQRGAGKKRVVADLLKKIAQVRSLRTSAVRWGSGYRTRCQAF